MGPVVYVLTMIAFALTFALVRIIIPALVSLHNDGALVCALILVVATPIGWYFFWGKILRPFFEGKYR
jgi:hypothetical protein